MPDAAVLAQHGPNAAYAHRRLDKKRDAVVVVRNPERELGTVLEALGRSCGYLAPEFQSVETAYAAYLYPFASQQRVTYGADRILQNKMQRMALSYGIIAEILLSEIVEQRHGIETFVRETLLLAALLFPAFVFVHAAHNAMLPVVVVSCAELVTALVKIHVQRARPQIHRVHTAHVSVVQIEKPAEKRQCASVGCYLIKSLTVLPLD